MVHVIKQITKTTMLIAAAELLTETSKPGCQAKGYKAKPEMASNVEC
jgi:hypothetical protein